MPKPSEAAMSQIGQRIVWTQYEPTFRHVEGICTDVEFTCSTVSNERGEFPGVRFRIKPEGGGRQVWTCTFADEGVELPEDIGV